MSTDRPLSERPELRRWLANVIYAFVHDEPTEPTEGELTGELDALEALLRAATPGTAPTPPEANDDH